MAPPALPNRRPQHPTAREEEILRAIRHSIQDRGEALSVRQPAREIGMNSPASVVYHLRNLEERGAPDRRNRHGDYGRTVGRSPLSSSPPQPPRRTGRGEAVALRRLQADAQDAARSDVSRSLAVQRRSVIRLHEAARPRPGPRPARRPRRRGHDAGI
ncbi:hypothetical protein [Streptomyces sp. NPDC058295]|uniref:LexA family protein n=1 Tax=Streptomyces sp. NPDC058295 TaxID=3346431 RepID=UPI0036EE2C62